MCILRSSRPIAAATVVAAASAIQTGNTQTGDTHATLPVPRRRFLANGEEVTGSPCFGGPDGNTPSRNAEVESAVRKARQIEERRRKRAEQNGAQVFIEKVVQRNNFPYSGEAGG